MKLRLKSCLGLLAFLLVVGSGISWADEDAPLVRMELAYSYISDSGKVGYPMALPAGDSYSVALRITIASGYHINSDQPNSPDLIPTTLTLSAVDGISLEQVEVPAPEQHMVRGEEQPWLVWDNQVVFTSSLHIDKDVKPGSYELVFNLTYQACDDQMCQMPTSERLKFLLQVVAPGQPSLPINDDAFK